MEHSRKGRWMIVAVVLVVVLLVLAGKLLPGRNLPTGGGPLKPAASSTSTVSALFAELPTLVAMTLTPLPPDYATHIAATLAARPTRTPTATSTLAPPACKFPLGHATTTESKPEEYAFSEPTVVLTAAQGNYYSIAAWLPDNQQVLMTEALRQDRKPGEVSSEAIRLFNPETGQAKVYAIRSETHELPIWNPKLNALVYPIMKFYDIDSQAGTYKFTRQLWISYGDPNTAQMLAEGLPQLPLAIKPDGSETVYLKDKELFKLDTSMKPVTSIPIDVSRWDYATARRDNRPVSYEMAWQPGTDLIFLYSEGATGGGGYTFILNADTGHICELNFEGWAEVAHWSADGRYLAVIRAKEYHFLYSTTDLIVLDALTGKLVALGVTPQEIEGGHYVDDFAWAPDSRHLLALASIIRSTDPLSESNLYGLYLIEFLSGQSVNVVPAYRSPLNSWQIMAWSADGSKLVIHCPIPRVDRICLIRVQRARQ